MLGWSIKLFRVFGIQLSVHASFLLLLAYYGYAGWQERGWTGLAWSLGLIVLFFGCVVLHELGHSLTARRFGVRVPRILLLPIGGMAEFDRIPRQPAEELLITVAGPAVNFALALLLLPLAWSGLAGAEDLPAFSFGALLEQLWWSNLAMGVFNFLPIFPMDGGRIVRALLAFKLPYLRATWWAMATGRTLSLLIVLAMAAYVGGSWLLGREAEIEPNAYMFIVLFSFIFFVGAAEYRHTLRRERDAFYFAPLVRPLPVAPTEDADALTYHGRN